MTDPSNVFQTRAQGKFLLTGEYAVLDGAQALAIPLHFGQTLSANTSETPGLLQWTALEADGSPWLSTSIRLDDLSIATASDEAPARTVRDLLLACRRQRPEFLVQATGLELQTQTDFPRPWGLGTSSTLIAALALWSGADPYRLLAETLGGSGYDIACAYAASPLLFQLKKGSPTVQFVDYQPDFAGQLYFVYLGKKQNSREGIRRYREIPGDKSNLIDALSELTAMWLETTTLEELEKVIERHEILLSGTLELPRAKDLHFSDYWGAVKSLGAWGGDFVLVTSEKDESTTRAYFLDKGFDVFLPWRDMIL